MLMLIEQSALRFSLNPSPLRPACIPEAARHSRAETADKEIIMAVTNTPNTKDMMQKDLYVIFTRAVAPREEIMKMLPQHLERQVELEKQGILFAAGPMEPEDSEKPRTGMIIVRADSFEHANEIAMGDPFHAAGLREFEVWNWSMNEGSFTVTINYSDKSADVI